MVRFALGLVDHVKTVRLSKEVSGYKILRRQRLQRSPNTVILNELPQVGFKPTVLVLDRCSYQLNY